MKKIIKSSLVLLLAAASFAAFTSLSKYTFNPNADARKQLIGEWRNIYLKIVIHHGDGSVVTMEADSSNWEERLKIHPIRTHFESNGTYYSEYFNLKDSIVRRPSGKWSLKRDSLTMTQLIPQKSVYRFLLKIKEDKATFNGNIDFDGDGRDDDVYYGIQKKYN